MWDFGTLHGNFCIIYNWYVEVIMAYIDCPDKFISYYELNIYIYFDLTGL